MSPATVITISTLFSQKAAPMAGSLTLGLLVGVDSQEEIRGQKVREVRMFIARIPPPGCRLAELLCLRASVTTQWPPSLGFL